jgi:LPXTG-motif cell wall-anchored protein
MPEFMNSWYFIIAMAVLLVALIGLLLYLRKKGAGDED